MGLLRQSLARCPTLPQEKHLKLLEREALLPDLVIGFASVSSFGVLPRSFGLSLAGLAVPLAAAFLTLQGLTRCRSPLLEGGLT